MGSQESRHTGRSKKQLSSSVHRLGGEERLQNIHLMQCHSLEVRYEGLSFTGEPYTRTRPLHLNQSLLVPQSTYINRVQSSGIWHLASGIWHLPNYWPSHPLSTQRVCPPPAPKSGGTHSPGGEGVGGQYFGRRQTLDCPLTVQSLYDWS